MVLRFGYGQGDSFWAMLEDLSKNDPQGYEEFIQQQFEEAKRAQRQACIQ